jgi:hypothetical protein
MIEILLAGNLIMNDERDARIICAWVMKVQGRKRREVKGEMIHLTNDAAKD